MTSKRLVQEAIPILKIAVPRFDDPKVEIWARNLEGEINKVLIRILQKNLDRLVSALTLGTTGITTLDVFTDQLTLTSGTKIWKIAPSGTKLIMTYDDGTVTDWDGV